MSIVNATNFRKNMFDYLENTIIANDTVTITTKSGNVVLVNEEEYRGLIETAYLNSMPGMAESIKMGMETPSDELVELDWKKDV